MISPDVLYSGVRFGSLLKGGNIHIYVWKVLGYNHIIHIQAPTSPIVKATHNLLQDTMPWIEALP